MRHQETVQHIYQSFGRGDVPAILECLAENVEWEYGVNSTDVPWLQPHRGRANVGLFFQSLAAVDIHRFEVKKLLESDNLVVSLVELEATVRKTGRRVIETDEVHIWYFNTAGLVAKFRHRVDTHQHWTAYSA
jgi:ketosteroid isomerase-like protein